jgi:RNA polymerase sigma factor (sigma-70 family)
MNDVIGHLRQAALLREGGGLTDSQLLDGFITRRDEAAFTVLVRRHGPMVLGVARRVLGNHHDAEDALQATFLVLARKAASLKSRELVGPWLYGVAYRTALRARDMNARRRAKEEQAREMRRPEAPTDDGWRELLPLLDRELDRLPERYRVAVVLCDLQGVTRRDAARRLNLPEGTVSSQLTRARRLLARRLARYGLAVSGGALAAALSGKPASACVTGALAASTAKAAVLVAAGQGLAAGAVPARVLALTEGVVKAMFLNTLKSGSAVVVLLGALGAGAGLLALLRLGAQPTATSPKVEATRGGADDLEALRLEVEALRRELRATREELRNLAAEVRGHKGEGGTAPRAKDPFGPDSGRTAPSGTPAGADTEAQPVASPENAAFQQPPGALNRVGRGAPDPLAEAEAALKKLKEHPDDKQAADELELALKHLKGRAKPQAGTEKPQKQ